MPNWDRDAKRPPPPPPAPVEKPKPRPKPKPKKPDVVIEDIEFKTPPMTPPPPKPDIKKVPEFKRDDEFWDFYDQSLPLP